MAIGAGIPTWAGLARDLTEEQEAERYREASDEKLRRIIATPMVQLGPDTPAPLPEQKPGWKINPRGIETPRGEQPSTAAPVFEASEDDPNREYSDLGPAPMLSQADIEGDPIPVEYARNGVGGPPGGEATDAQIIDILKKREERQGPDHKVRGQILQAPNPDEAAKALDLAQRNGVNRLEVEQNRSTFEAVERAKEIERLRQTAPKLKSWMDADPANLEIAYDDTNNLGWWEQVQSFLNPGSITMEEVGAALRTGAVEGGAQQFYGAVEIGIGINRMFEWIPGMKALNDVGEEAARTERQKAAITAAANMPKGDTFIERGIYSAAQSAPASIEAMILSVITKSPFVGAASMGVGTAGTAYGEAEDAGKPFLDRMRYATTQGGIEAGTEFIPLKFIVGDLAKDTPFAKMFFRQAAAEGIGEQAATFLQDASTWLELNPEKTLGEFMAERPNAALETLVASTLMSGVQTTIASGAQKGVDALDQNAQQKRSDTLAKTFEAMAQGAASSKLLKRLPDKYREVVAQATKDGPLESVRVQPEAFNELAQSAGVTTEQLAQAFRIDPNEIVSAVESGEDVVIPAGNYAAALGWAKKEIGISGEQIHTAFAPNMRLRADDFTAKEREAMKAVFDEEQKARAETGTKEQGFADSADRVRETIREQVAGLGIFNTEAANTQAAIVGEMVTTLAERTGQDPETLWKEQGFDIVTSLTGETQDDALSQSMARQPVETNEIELNWASQDLTPRQFEVWKAAREGLSNEQIAERINEIEPDAVVSPEAVKVALTQARTMGYDAQKVSWNDRGLAPETQRIINLKARGVANKDIADAVFRDRDSAKARNQVGVLVNRHKALIEARRQELTGSAGREYSLAQSSLDMSEAARMQRAREQGFDVETPLYHGTAADFDAFDPRLRGMNDKLADDSRLAHFFSTSPDIASQYADEAAGGAARRRLGIDDGRAASGDKKAWDQYDAEKRNGSSVMPVYARLKNPYVVTHIKEYDSDMVREALQYAEARNHDGVIFKGMNDALRRGARPGDVYAVFDPENIRGKFAAFDPSQSGSSKLLAQGERGTFSPRADRSIIRLFESANLSTIAHEGAHWYLDTLWRMSQTENPHPFVLEQLAAVLEWQGKSPNWTAMFDEQGKFTAEGRDIQEAFAESFEAYLREGKAPTSALRSVFASFKAWLLRIYKSVSQIGGRVRLNDEIRQVFDRMLATEEAINAATTSQARDSAAMAQALLKKGIITEKAVERTTARLAAARERAEAEMMARLMEDYERSQKAWWRNEERQVRREVQSEIDERPEQRAYAWLSGKGWRDTREDQIAAAEAEADAMVALAQADGYLGRDIGEAFGWVMASRKGLPMDKKSRLERAEEQGFNTSEPMYHGSHTSFSAFKASATGAYGPGVYLGDPDVAGAFAGYSPWDDVDEAEIENGNIVPVFVRGKLYELTPEQAETINQMLDMSDESKGRELVDNLKAQGYAGVINRENSFVNVFDPSNVRSINAAFDPDMADSEDLLAQADGSMALEFLDSYVENPSQRSIERMQRKLLLEGKGGVVRLIRYGDKVIAFDGYNFTHDMAFSILGIDGRTAARALMERGDTLDTVRWYDGAGESLAQTVFDLSTPDQRRAWVESEVVSDAIPGETTDSRQYGFMLDSNTGVVVSMALDPSGAAMFEWTFLDRLQDKSAPYEKGEETLTRQQLKGLLVRVVAVLEEDIRQFERNAYVFTPASEARAKIYGRLFKLLGNDTYSAIEYDTDVFLIHPEADIDANGKILPRPGSEDGPLEWETSQDAEARADAFYAKVRSLGQRSDSRSGAGAGRTGSGTQGGDALAQSVGPSRQLDAMGFYSALREAVANSKQNKASAEQWKATLSKLPGVKAEEIEWTGVNDWLDSWEAGASIPRDVLANFLQNNGVKVEEVSRSGDLGGDKFYFTATQDEDGIDTWGVFTDNEGLVRYEENEYDAADFVENANAELRDARETKFDTFTLPGGEDYTELLLTLPNVDGPATHWDDPNVVAHARFKTRYAPVPTTEQEEADNRAWNDAQPAIDLLRDEVRALSAQRARELQDGGYAYDREPPSTPSLAPLQAAVDKLRAAEAALPKPIDRNRRQKVLALEEIQSDWHQKGRTEGYAGVFDQKKLDAAQEKLDAALAARAAAKVELEQFLLADSSIAAAVIRLKESPNFAGRSDGDIARHAFQTGTRLMSSQANFQATELDKVTQTAYLREREAGLARDAARSPGGIPNAPFKNNGWVNLVLKRMIRYAAENNFDTLAWVPGSVQNGNEVEADDNRADFYDKIVPNAANKLGKKYDAQVSQIGIRLQGRDTGRPVDRQTFWALPITPQLKAAATEGFPLFQSGADTKGRTAPPPSLAPMRLDLQAVKDQYGEEALASLPPEVAAYSAQATDADQFLEVARDVRKTLSGKRPKTLWKFLSTSRVIGSGNDKISYRGIRDEGNELTAAFIGESPPKGLIVPDRTNDKKTRAYTLRDATYAAWEEGYFGGSPPSTTAFIEALKGDIDGTAPRYARADVATVEQIKSAEQWERWFDENGIDISEKDPAALKAKLETLLTGQQENAISPDEAAPFFKMPDGNALLQGLAQGPKRDRLIREETRKRMIERHGDPFRDGTIMREAETFARNEVQQRQIEIELEALAKAAGQFAASNLAKQQAVENLRTKQVREVLNYNQWLILEQRWGKKALEAAEKGKFDDAARYKKFQLLNLHMFREGRKLAEKIETQRKELLAYATKPRQQRLYAAGKEYAENMNSLLDDYQLRNETRKGENKRLERAAWIKAQMAAIDPFAAYQDTTKTAQEQQVEAAEAIERSRALAMEQPTDARGYKSLSVDEFMALEDEAGMIWKMATLADQLLKEGKRRRLTLAAEDIAAEIITNQPKEKPPEPIESDAPGEKVKRGALKYFAMHRTMQSLAHQFAGGKDGGQFWSYFVKPLNEAFAKLSTLRKQMGDDLTKLFGAYSKQEISRFYKDRQTFQLSNGPVSLTTQGRLAVALNVGNEKNRQRLMDSMGWTLDDVQKITDTLTKRDWDFVQATWDYLNTWFPEANRVHEAVHGAPMDKVEPMQVATKFGIYAGGYYPIAFDPELSSKSAQRQTEADAKKVSGRVDARNRPGFGKKRVEGKVTLPLKLSVFDVITRHLDQVATSIATEEALFDAGRLIRRPEVEQAIVQHHGRQIYNTIVNTLVTTKFGMEGTSGVLAHLRNGATVVGLGWSIGTALLQPLGVTNSIVRVGGYWMAKGYARMGKDAATIQSSARWVMDRSEFMRHRRQAQSPEMAALRDSIKGSGITPGWLKRSMFALMANTQFYGVDLATWYGGWYKAKAAGFDDVEAAAQADQAVIDAQGGGELHQTAAIQTGAGTKYAAALRLLTNFLSYMITTYNLATQRARNADSAAKVAALTFDMVLLLAIPVAGKMALDAWTKGGGDDDDDELWERYGREQVAFLLSPFVGISQAAGSVRGDDAFGYRGPAGLGIFGELTNAGKAAAEADFDQSFWRPANKAAGIVFHYPANQLDRTVRGAWAMWNGETSDPKALFFGPPPN